MSLPDILFGGGRDGTYLYLGSFQSEDIILELEVFSKR